MGRISVLSKCISLFSGILYSLYHLFSAESAVVFTLVNVLVIARRGYG